MLPISPIGVAFPYGAMAFTVTDVPVGGSTEMFVGVTDAVAGYWKLTATGWSLYPSSRPVSGGLMFTLVDGGPGDADGIANGIIVDPGAVGVPNVGPTAPDRTVSTPIDTPVTDRRARRCVGQPMAACPRSSTPPTAPPGASR